MERTLKIALVGAGMFGGDVHLRAYADLQRFGIAGQLDRGRFLEFLTILPFFRIFTILQSSEDAEGDPRHLYPGDAHRLAVVPVREPLPAGVAERQRPGRQFLVGYDALPDQHGHQQRSTEGQGVVDHGFTVADAIAAPRIHLDGDVLHLEGGVDPGVADTLEERGYDVVRWGEPNLYFGGAAAVGLGGDGTFEAAGDPRRGGAGVVVR